ncbi:MAG: hypothetical protein ACKVZ0_07365 [Gemmatimonadales bacterium]
MITPDARSRLTTSDVDLVAECLGWPTPQLSQPAPDDLDAALDAGDLRGALLDGRMPGPSPSLFFYVLVRQALLAEGLDDRSLADYYAAMLREFGDRGRAHRPAAADDQEHHYLIDILNDLHHSTGRRLFLVSAHLGNYALWLSGIFPDWIEGRRTRRGGPSLAYYETLGRHGFAQASEHAMASIAGLGPVLAASAEQFPLARRALNRVRADLKLAA